MTETNKRLSQFLWVFSLLTVVSCSSNSSLGQSSPTLANSVVTNIPTLTPIPAKSTAAQGYAIKVAYGDDALKLYTNEVYSYSFNVQSGWRPWVAKISLENPSG